MKRTALFLATNLAIVLVLSITMRMLGVEPYLNEQGLDLNAPLVFAAVFGFGGAFISLALPKQKTACGIAGNMRGGLIRLFASHPALDEHVAALRSERP